MNYPGFLEYIIGESATFSPLRSLLFDGVTGLPTLALVIQSMKDAAANQKKLGVICIDTTKLELLEEEHGWELVDKLLHHMRVFLDSNASRFAPLKLFSIHRMPGDNFLVILSSDDSGKPLAASHVAKVSSELEERLNEYLASRFPSQLSAFARVFNGHSILE